MFNAMWIKPAKVYQGPIEVFFHKALERQTLSALRQGELTINRVAILSLKLRYGQAAIGHDFATFIYQKGALARRGLLSFVRGDRVFNARHA